MGETLREKIENIIDRQFQGAVNWLPAAYACSKRMIADETLQAVAEAVERDCQRGPIVGRVRPQDLGFAAAIMDGEQQRVAQWLREQAGQS